MHARHIVLAVLAAAVTLTSVAAAGPAAAKQRVGITMKNLPDGTFLLTPLPSRLLALDSGTVSPIAANHAPRIVMREGQRVSIYRPVVWLLKGKRGSLTIREPRNVWVDAGSDLGGPEIGTGTWKVVRGTGQYAGMAGGGRSAHAGLNGGTSPWFARQEGFLTVR
jgi:hypothetical protein